MLFLITILSGSLLALCGVCKTNRGFNSFLMEKIESLVAGDFDYMYITNSYREKTKVHLINNYDPDLVGKNKLVTFTYHGEQYMGEFFYSINQDIYCCFAGGYDECKPSGENNDPEACYYEQIGFKWWNY